MFAHSCLATSILSGSFLSDGHLTFTVRGFISVFIFVFLWTKPEDILTVKSRILRGFLRYS